MTPAALIKYTAANMVKRAAKPAWRAGAGFRHAGASASGFAGQAAFSTMMAPFAPAGLLLKGGGKATMAVGRGALSAGKSFGAYQKKRFSTANRMTTAAMAVGSASMFAAAQVPRLRSYIQESREKDPVNATGLPQAIHRGR